MSLGGGGDLITPNIDKNTDKMLLFKDQNKRKISRGSDGPKASSRCRVGSPLAALGSALTAAHKYGLEKCSPQGRDGFPAGAQAQRPASRGGGNWGPPGRWW